MSGSFDNWKIREGDILKNKGACYLTNTDLIAYILQDRDKADGIFDNLKYLRQLETLERGGLESFLGTKDTEVLMASIELGKRIQKDKRPKQTGLNSTKAVYDLYKGDMANLPYEQFLAVLLDVKNTVLDSKVLFQGGLNSSTVDPKRLYHYALANNACSVIAIHNHPSGDYKPSYQDNLVTKKIAQGGEILQVKLLDHMIISDRGYYSYRTSQPELLY